MQYIRNLSCVVAAGIALMAVMPDALAEDILKLAITQRGAWDSAAPELGQLAGVFKKDGIVLELLYTEDASETERLVKSGSVDVGLGIDVMRVLRAHAKGDPVRIIGANTTGSANYWYVPTSSPIKTIKDVDGRTVAYSTTRASGYYDVFDFMEQYRVKVRLMPTAGAAATFNLVMSGQVAVGWATPPFGIEAKFASSREQMTSPGSETRRSE